MKRKVVKYALLVSLAGHGLHLPKEKHIEVHSRARRDRKSGSALNVLVPTRCLHALHEGIDFAMDLCRCGVCR